MYILILYALSVMCLSFQQLMNIIFYTVFSEQKMQLFYKVNIFLKCLFFCNGFSS